MEISEEKKKRIEALSIEEMSYEINLGRKSRFQREAFAYLETCYLSRMMEKEPASKYPSGISWIDDSSETSQLSSPHPSTDKPNAELNWHQKPIGLIGIGVLIVVIGSMTLWVLNHYFDLGLF